MAEPKPLASLSAGLLARKGTARPAMRRQIQLPGSDLSHLEDLGWNDMGYVVDPQDDAEDQARRADHGLSPMANGHDPAHDDAAATLRRDLDAAADRASMPSIGAAPDSDMEPAVPEVRVQQAAIEAAMAPVATVQEPAVAPALPRRSRTAKRATAGSNGNFAFTLRLDPDRHLRLRIASAANNRSTQQILIGLVDDFLASLPEIDAFAAKLPSSKSQATS